MSGGIKTTCTTHKPHSFWKRLGFKKPINPKKKSLFCFVFPATEQSLLKKDSTKKMREKTYWVAVPVMLGSGVGVNREHMG